MNNSRAEDTSRANCDDGYTAVGGEGAGSSKANKKKKKKMQKVNPAQMLGFTVNAAERPNVGEIQSIP